MSLYALQTIAPCFQYVDLGRCWTTPPSSWPSDMAAVHPSFWGSIYSTFLITCPRQYGQNIWYLWNFFYHPQTDQLHLHLFLNKVTWPGWYRQAFTFNAADGAGLSELGMDGMGPGSLFWSYGRSLSAGSNGSLWGVELGKTVCMYNADTGRPLTGGSSYDLNTWPNWPTFTNCVVSSTAGYLAECSGCTLNIWRNINTSPEKFAVIYIPTYVSSMCYESDEILWLIGTDGTILKINYQIPRIEMCSMVQDPSADAKQYLITFDTNRHRVVVFRWLPDATNGACRSQLEFYWPMCRAATLTHPVPYTSLKANEYIYFVAHLIGDRGEPITPWSVSGELLASATGALLTPFVTTGLGGRLLLQYKTTSGCTDTLKLTAETEDV